MKLTSSSKDLIIALGCSFIAMLLAGYFDANEAFIEWAEQYEDYELDELPVAAAALALCFSWFAWRRWSDLRLVQGVLQQRLREIEELQRAEQKGKEFAIEKSRQLTLVGEMTESLLISESEEEALRIFNGYAKRSFAKSNPGAVVVCGSQNDGLVISAWATPEERFQALEFKGCWSHRSNKVYDTDMGFCERSCGRASARQVCIPVSNAGSCHGVVAVELSAAGDDNVADLVIEEMIPAVNVLAITLSNLSLRNDLFQQSILDPLTGLLNRRGWQEKVDSLPVGQSDESQFSIVTIDIDDFKLINDELGHEAGDAALKNLALIISSNIRTEDLACRIGGDEIVILLPEMNREEARDRAICIAKRYQSACREQFLNAQLAFSLSVGVACYPEDGRTVQDLVARSDSYLYRAKRRGKNQIVCNSVDEGNFADA